MDFEQWMKEVMKGASFPTDEKNKDIFKRVHELSHGDLEDEEEASA